MNSAREVENNLNLANLIKRFNVLHSYKSFKSDPPWCFDKNLSLKPEDIKNKI
jgi:hypothetical protein